MDHLTTIKRSAVIAIVCVIDRKGNTKRSLFAIAAPSRSPPLILWNHRY